MTQQTGVLPVEVPARTLIADKQSSSANTCQYPPRSPPPIPSHSFMSAHETRGTDRSHAVLTPCQGEGVGGRGSVRAPCKQQARPMPAWAERYCDWRGPVQASPSEQQADKGRCRAERQAPQSWLGPWHISGAVLEPHHPHHGHLQSLCWTST